MYQVLWVLINKPVKFEAVFLDFGIVYNYRAIKVCVKIVHTETATYFNIKTSAVEDQTMGI